MIIQGTVDATDTEDRPNLATRLGEHISTGKLMASRWLRVGGLLGPRVEITRNSSQQVDSAPPTRPKVSMAIDGDAMSESVVHASQRLAGETATYLAINVGPGPSTASSMTTNEMSSSTTAGSQSSVPSVMTVAVPAAMPRRMASTRSCPFARPVAMPATSESPAPIVLRTRTVGARIEPVACPVVRAQRHRLRWRPGVPRRWNER